MDIRTITVVGAGTMGHGIAELAAVQGFRTTLVDSSREALARAKQLVGYHTRQLIEAGKLPAEASERLAEIAFEENLARGVRKADLVIEAIPERLPLKLTFFTELGGLALPHTILASNTSSIPITRLAEVLRRPERMVGFHFFTPPMLLRAVEVIRGRQTADDVFRTMLGVAQSLKRIPIPVERDVRCFVVNRCLVGPYIEEPAWSASRNEASPGAIDARMTRTEGLPVGPFRVLDIIGMDVARDVIQSAADINAESRAVPVVIDRMVLSGLLGQKTGRGFYDWADWKPLPEDGSPYDPSLLYAVMANEAAWLVGEGVASRETIDLASKVVLGIAEGLWARVDHFGLDHLRQCLADAYRDHGLPQYQLTDALRHWK